MAKKENRGFASEILHDYKLANIRLFIALILVIIAFASYIVYDKYKTDDTATTTETLEIQDVQSIDNSHIKIGNDIWEKSN